MGEEQEVPVEVICGTLEGGHFTYKVLRFHPGKELAYEEHLKIRQVTANYRVADPAGAGRNGRRKSTATP